MIDLLDPNETLFVSERLNKYLDGYLILRVQLGEEIYFQMMLSLWYALSLALSQRWITREAITDEYINELIHSSIR